MVFKVAANVSIRFFKVDPCIAKGAIGADHCARVEKFGVEAAVFENFGYDVCGQTFTETHHIVERARGAFLYEIHAVQYILQFVGSDLDLCKDAALLFDADKLPCYVEVSFLDLCEGRPVLFISKYGATAHVDEGVGDTAKGRKDDGDIFLSIGLENFDDGFNPFCIRYRRSAKLQNFHILTPLSAGLSIIDFFIDLRPQFVFGAVEIFSGRSRVRSGPLWGKQSMPGATP